MESQDQCKEDDSLNHVPESELQESSGATIYICILCNRENIPIEESDLLDGSEIIKVTCHLLHVNWPEMNSQFQNKFPLCPPCLRLTLNLVNLREKLYQLETEIREKIKEIQIAVIGDTTKTDDDESSSTPNPLREYFIQEHRTKILMEEKIIEFNSTINESRHVIEVEPSYVQLHVGPRRFFENHTATVENFTSPFPIKRRRGRPKRKQTLIPSPELDLDSNQRQTRLSMKILIKDEPEDINESREQPTDSHLDFAVKEEQDKDDEFELLQEESDENKSTDSEFSTSKSPSPKKGRSRKYRRTTRASSRRLTRSSNNNHSSKDSSIDVERGDSGGRTASLVKWQLETKEDGRMFFRDIEVIKKPGITPEGKYVLECGSCGKEYADKSKGYQFARSRFHMIKQHILAAHLGGYRCQLCHKDFSEQKTLNYHMNSKHGPKKQRNPMGYEKWPGEITKDEEGRMFYESIEIQKIDQDDGSFNVTCGLCDKTINSNQALRRKRCPYRLLILHIKVAHGDEYKCDLCEKKYTDVRNLESHRLLKHSLNPPRFPCDICQKPITSIKFMRVHQWSHKSVEEKAAAIASGEKAPVTYAEHMKRRKEKYGDVSYQCTQCGKTFEFLCNLKRHETIHDEKTHRCMKCGKFFVSQERLRDHTKFVHESERVNKKYYCKYCPKNFTTRSAWAKHERQHTGEIPFSCPTCFKGFALKQSMTSHAKKCTAAPRDLSAQPHPTIRRRKKAQVIHVVTQNVGDESTPSISQLQPPLPPPPQQHIEQHLHHHHIQHQPLGLVLQQPRPHPTLDHHKTPQGFLLPHDLNPNNFSNNPLYSPFYSRHYSSNHGSGGGGGNSSQPYM